MNLAVMKNVVTRIGGRAGLVAQKHSPEILVGVGLAAMVTSVVLASRATLKAQKPTETFKNQREDVVALKDEDAYHGENSYTKDIAYVYGNYGIELVKLYGPAVTIGVAGIACILSAHGILKQRNAALAAAYTVLEKSYAQYRKRVIEEYGEEKDEEFRHGVRSETVTEKGKKVVKKTQDPNAISGYARWFDEFSSEWSKTHEYNMVFLRAQQHYHNDLLKARGHVFLNEVYDALGLERSQEGAVVGWVLSKDGDNFIDFGIYDPDDSDRRVFVNNGGVNDAILLDFNVDGLIFDKI